MKDLTVSTDITIKEAMEALNKTAEKVLLVTNSEKQLIGTLTDGDVRRYILKKQNLTDTIENAYRRNPKSIFKDDYNEIKVKALFMQEKIGLIPIIDRNHMIVDFIDWHKFFGNKKKKNFQNINAPTVIMAGGKGTRLDPFTRVLPKPLIPIGDRPVIDHIFERFRLYGIKEFYLTIQHMSKIIRAYFEEKAPDYSIEFVEEDEPRGTAGSLGYLRSKLNSAFFVSNCDIIVEADYADLYTFHIVNGYDITLVASAKQFSIPYGICELNGGGSLERIKEKPEFNFLVNAGMYIVNPNVLSLIPKQGIYHITQLIADVRKNGMQVGVYPISEDAWTDVGQWVEYKKALERLG